MSLLAYGDLLSKSNCLIVPESLNVKYMKTIHQDHFRTDLYFHSTREIVFWHEMPLDIEDYV